MYRPTVRAIASAAPLFGAFPRVRPARRLISTAPPHKQSRSWRNSAARWALAGAAVYFYNTSTAFAEQPAHAVHDSKRTLRDESAYPTVASVAEERRARQSQQRNAQQESPQDSQSSTQNESIAVSPDAETVAPGSPDELEEEAGQQGAFNEETGEINWDCPCLGGMAHGPCGEQFRAAFSCFVFSKEEPKGVDCIEHFKTMQNCFREHPDIYGSELEDDDAPQDSSEDQAEPVSADTQPAPALATDATTQTSAVRQEAASSAVQSVAEEVERTPSKPKLAARDQRLVASGAKDEQN